MKRILQLAVAALATAALAAVADTEITFYYPVAVGGPITKTIDQMSADFERENPGIKVKPVYTGTYQESLVKARTVAAKPSIVCSMATSPHVMRSRWSSSPVLATSDN